jgi:PAS domain S-box-containing protein
MKIKTKILISNSMTVVFAILLTMAIVFYFLDRGIENQTETLLEDLIRQSSDRVKESNRLLRFMINDDIFHFSQSLDEFSLDETIRQGILMGQWKSILSLAESYCKNTRIDFMVVYDEQGRAIVNWPNTLDEALAERHFKELELFERFQSYAKNENLVNVPVFSSIDRWSRKTRDGYVIDGGDDTGIVILAASVIPNEYFDEPLGYVFIGYGGRQLWEPLDGFFHTTGHVSLLAVGDKLLAWAGLPGKKDALEKSLQRLRMDLTRTGPSTRSGHVFNVAGEPYNCAIEEFRSLSNSTTIVTPKASAALIISGESARINIETSAKIRREGEETKDSLLKIMAVLSILVLVLTVAIVNVVGREISRPIEIAAGISDRIASGDLDHVLDESSSDETGRLSRSMNKMIGTLKNLGEKNQRQLKAIEESKYKNEAILAAIREGVILIDGRTRRIIDANPAAMSLINAERDDLIGESYDRYCLPQEGTRLPIRPDESSTGYTDETLVTTDGRRVSVLETVVPITLDEKECLLVSFIDITPLKKEQEERQRLESQLQKAKKMEAIGLLAGGVAHDLNNILSGIVSYPDLLLTQLSEGSTLRKPIEIIKKTGDKAAAIVQDLLTLARRGIADTEVVNLNTIIDDYLNSPEHDNLKSFHPDVQIETDLESNLLNIAGSPVHLSKMIMNLITNAAEAMPRGGKISISTASRYLEKVFIGDQEVREGDYIVLTISDTGVGISPEATERIFEPFYTKKVMGRSGTGLGMAVVWGTVKDHSGYIELKTAEGKGTTFSIYLPVSRRELSRKKEKVSIASYSGDGESILVVDDVEEQREIASDILSELGYVVASVESGEQAVEYVRNRKVDLLLLDMIMEPGIDGLETFRRIRALRPQQKAIMASGFSDPERVKAVQKLGMGQYIKKPYSLEKIGIAVREELKK